MPTVYASETKTREELEQENRELQILFEDCSAAYVTLYRGCAAAMACRDIVLRDGTMKNILAVYDRLQRAMNEADHRMYCPNEEDGGRNEKVWCSVCEKYLTTDEEKAGHCIVCFQVNRS